MKIKMVVVALAMSASTAFAADVTMNGTTRVEVCAGTAGQFTISKNATAPQFIQENFKQGCSNNVYMSIAEDNSQAWGAAGSKKGKYFMIGNTNGGAPRATSSTVDPACSSCIAPDAEMTAAKDLGSS